MKDKTERTFYEVIKIVSHIALLTISTLLTINLFTSFSENPLYKVLWILLGVTLELIKVYLFVVAKAHLQLKRFTSYVKSFFLFLIYLGLAFVSFTASSGFTLMSIGQQASTSIILNESSDISLIDRELNQLDISIDSLRLQQETAIKKKGDIRADWSTEKQDVIISDITLDINTKNERINELLLEKSKIVNAKVSSKAANSSDIFTLLGEAINLSGEDTMLYLMLLLALLLEVITAATSGNYHLDKTKIQSNLPEDKHEETLQEETTLATTLPVQETVSYKLDNEELSRYIKALVKNTK
ncbi:MAG: hypothetical protein PF569_03925, partial [Candidatus Woesearchaeota archaeon]|nr:hypothetical protein [Candidatus Woesearchaeota archaeon]